MMKLSNICSWHFLNIFNPRSSALNCPKCQAFLRFAMFFAELHCGYIHFNKLQCLHFIPLILYNKIRLERQKQIWKDHNYFPPNIYVSKIVRKHLLNCIRFYLGTKKLYTDFYNKDILRYLKYCQTWTTCGTVLFTCL